MGRIIPTTETPDQPVEFLTKQPIPPRPNGPTCPSWCEVTEEQHRADVGNLGYWQHHQEVRDDDIVTVHLDATEEFTGRTWPAKVYIEVKGDDLDVAQALGVAKHIVAAAEQLVA